MCIRDRPVLSFLDELDARWADDTITVLIPEFVVKHWYENALHNQTALALKLALLQRKGTVVTSVPYHVSRRDRKEALGRELADGAEAAAAEGAASADGDQTPVDGSTSR